MERSKWLLTEGVRRTFRAIKVEEETTFGVVVGKQKLCPREHLSPLTGVFLLRSLWYRNHTRGEINMNKQRPDDSSV